MSERESMPYDVVIVGAGPAGLTAAIRLKQLSNENGQELSVCVLEKGSEVGAHILSGAVIDPQGMDELFPDWRDTDCPLAQTPVTENYHWVLTKKGKVNLPHLWTPPFLHNKGTYTTSLANLCRWLAGKAEELGVEIFPGFAAAEILYHEDGRVKGVATGDMGVARDGTRKPDYQPGLELHAKYTFFSEGARGHLTKQVIRQFDLDRDSQPQTYGLGVKELWDIAPEKHVPGRVIHTQGFPLDEHTNGGGWIYHQANGQVSIGFVTWLNYSNPYVSPFHEMQTWKTHPAVAELLEGGKRVAYGARVINEGGLQAIPELVFPGGALIGCSAGFLNVPRIKGVHGAQKSAMMAAEAAFEAIRAGREGDTLYAYPQAFRASWLYKELSVARNVAPLVKKFGDFAGSGLSGVNMWFEHFGVRMPFTMKLKPDHTTLWRKDQVKPKVYPKPDGVLTFDRLSSVFLSNTNHEEDQPVHLQLKDPSRPIEYNLPLYDEPSRLYCPAGVYEVVGEEEGDPKYVINAQNCVHCKTCDIKDPTQNINWVVPEGGGGPNYPNM
ncbi:electron transfer flavoprotein-ubiquinone oxidoreductase [Sphingomonas lenta]|uniref:Electron transfer flavoprotein-ubiquinone oxidoreductase n=1 Tax=Sphingomonas lenta TaxID=1141887 RepID=A0A2A2SK00_9SPHN|nr:electron transfer flavoprotein-ubiquinone oxidoreductase [Sphingomonas lenta]PAX09562.1 electron transfer flavoprotein-ubiquinone oxidoreductase [Sphingomonas lenta]